MKKIAIYLSDEYADFEQSYVAPLLARSKKYKIEYIGSKKQILSMGLMCVNVDKLVSSFNESQMDEYVAIILLGGDRWKKINYLDDELNELLLLFKKHNLLIAGICDAVTFLANNGYLNNVNHTGNTVEHLIKNCPGYTNKEHYIEKQSVVDKNLISANGTSSIEFARDVVDTLNALEDDSFKYWCAYMKNGLYKE